MDFRKTEVSEDTINQLFLTQKKINYTEEYVKGILGPNYRILIEKLLLPFCARIHLTCSKKTAIPLLPSLFEEFEIDNKLYRFPKHRVYECIHYCLALDLIQAIHNQTFHDWTQSKTNEFNISSYFILNFNNSYFIQYFNNLYHIFNNIHITNTYKQYSNIQYISIPYRKDNNNEINECGNNKLQSKVDYMRSICQREINNQVSYPWLFHNYISRQDANRCYMRLSEFPTEDKHSRDEYSEYQEFREDILDNYFGKDNWFEWDRNASIYNVTLTFNKNKYRPNDRENADLHKEFRGKPFTEKLNRKTFKLNNMRLYFSTRNKWESMVSYTFENYNKPLINKLTADELDRLRDLNTLFEQQKLLKKCKSDKVVFTEAMKQERNDILKKNKLSKEERAYNKAIMEAREHKEAVEAAMYQAYEDYPKEEVEKGGISTCVFNRDRTNPIYKVYSDNKERMRKIIGKEHPEWIFLLEGAINVRFLNEVRKICKYPVVNVHDGFFFSKDENITPDQIEEVYKKCALDLCAETKKGLKMLKSKRNVSHNISHNLPFIPLSSITSFIHYNYNKYNTLQYHLYNTKLSTLFIPYRKDNNNEINEFIGDKLQQAFDLNMKVNKTDYFKDAISKAQKNKSANQIESISKAQKNKSANQIESISKAVSAANIAKRQKFFDMLPEDYTKLSKEAMYQIFKNNGIKPSAASQAAKKIINGEWKI